MDAQDKKRYYFKHLNFPGLWRIIWFGRLTRLSEGSDNVSIYVYLGQLSDAENFKYALPHKYERVNLPIGDLPQLYIGAVLKDGFLLPPDEVPSKTRDLKIDLTKDNIQAIPRTAKDSSGYLISLTNEWGFYQEPQADSYLLGFYHNENQFGIIIPCVEILRFFYCYGSNIAKVMTSDRILNPDRWLYDSDKSFFNAQTGVVTLKPRLAVSKQSENFLANFISGTFILERAKQIPKQVAVLSRTDPERHFVVFPPLDGMCTINAAYYTHSNHLGQQIIVTKIISSDIRQKHSAIAIYSNSEKRDETQPKSGRTRVIVSNPKDFPIRFNSGLVNPTLGVEEHFDEELGQRFPNMMEVARVPLTNDNKHGGSRTDVATKEHAEGSTNDNGSLNSDIHKTIILPADGTLNLENDENSSAFVRIIKALELIRSTSLADVTFLGLTRVIQKGDDSDNGVIYNLPRSDHEEPWAFLDRWKLKQRKIVIASVVKEQATRILIEFEQRVSGECSTLVIWNSDIEVPKNDILFAVEECIKNGACYLDTRSYDHSWSKLRHSWKKNEHLNPKHFLDRIFEADSLVKRI